MLSPPSRIAPGLAGGEQHLTEYGFFVLEAYLESKIARGQTAKAARTKLDELEVVRRRRPPLSSLPARFPAQKLIWTCRLHSQAAAGAGVRPC